MHLKETFYRLVCEYLQHKRFGVERQRHQQLHSLRVFKVLQQEASRVLGLCVPPDHSVQKPLRGAVHQIRPALHHLGGQQSYIPIKSGELRFVHTLNEITAWSSSGPFADLLIDLCQLLVGAQALEHDPARSFPGFSVLSKIDVLYIEKVKETQATPHLEGHLAIHELAAPASAEAGRTLVEADKSAVSKLVPLKRGEQVVSVHQQNNKKRYDEEELATSVDAAKFERPQHADWLQRTEDGCR